MPSWKSHLLGVAFITMIGEEPLELSTRRLIENMESDKPKLN
jgi:hypothetical protein